MSMSFTGSNGFVMTTDNKNDKEWLEAFVVELRKKKLDKLADVLVEEIKRMEQKE